ncbi:MAG: hypothetical protein D6743_18370 [Calditrichaeota bacterium]|nr:MAG: hypothetical protein D6743_18370 [Calditrichota bacterium]
MNRGNYLLAFLLATLFILPGRLKAQLYFDGGRGLTYVQSAWTVDKGVLMFSAHSRAFGKVANFTDQSFTIWTVSGMLNFNYGLGRHVEISAAPRVYQDTNSPTSSSNTPDDVFLSVKLGSFNSPGSSMSYGVTLSTRIPTGKTHNIPFEPYAADRVGFGFMGLATYSKDPLYPDQALNIHLNVGYWNHNDVGVKVTNRGGPNAEPRSMTQELLYALGLKAPSKSFDFTAELFGNAFLQSPPPAVFSRESYLYFSPGVTYKPYRWFKLSFGVDVRMLDSSDKTLYQPAAGGVLRTLPDSQPNYPAWRLRFSTKFNILPTGPYRRNRRRLLLEKARKRRDLFEQLLKDQEDTESAEAELERIRAERIKAEQELERLRQILQGELQNSESQKGQKAEEGSDQEKNNQ